jgi:DNA-binding beta-propeller fold protein YncE
MRSERRAAAQVGAASALTSPVRTIRDPYPSFAAVAVDPQRNEVVFTDESLFQILVYSRLENTPAAAPASTPKRVLAGKLTDIEFQSGVYVDGKTGEIYVVNNDTRDTTSVFGHGRSGDVKPDRSIKTPHGTFGIGVAESHNEVLLTIQHDAAIVTYRQNAGPAEPPLRLLQGDRTGLGDPHGIAYDPNEDVVFVANFGSRSSNPPGQRTEKPNWPFERNTAVPGSGSIDPPSITVHRRLASGNEPPLRVIHGPATQLNWPTGVAVDPTRRELYVTNDTDHSVVVFATDAKGNTAPKRVLKGRRTRLANPTGVAIDLKNN